jgi:hypothetical protein
MSRKRSGKRAVCIAVCVTALATLGLAGNAAAHLIPPYTIFQQCPWTNTEVKRCLYAVTEGGEVVLGKKPVPIVNPAVLQGGYGAVVGGFSQFYGATNGETLSKAPQPVPGGLAGIVPPEGSPPLVKAAIKFFFENGLTGVNATLELAKPASDIQISELHLGEEEEVALKLPVKIHLENPFLGSSCYVGSSSAPVIWELTTGETAPPGPNEPIKGSAGNVSFLDEGRILVTEEAELVDNAWSAPSASGCGGFLLESLVDPIIDGTVGLPAAAGENTAILVNTASIATTAAVKRIDEENP